MAASGFVSSTTHYDIFNRNGGVDDFTHVVSYVRENIDKYDFVFIGGVPQQLEDLHKDKKSFKKQQRTTVLSIVTQPGLQQLKCTDIFFA